MTKRSVETVAEEEQLFLEDLHVRQEQGSQQLLDVLKFLVQTASCRSFSFWRDSVWFHPCVY